MTSRTPDRDQAIVLMHEGGMSLREIAEVVGLSCGSQRAVGSHAAEKPLFLNVSRKRSVGSLTGKKY